MTLADAVAWQFLSLVIVASAIAWQVIVRRSSVPSTAPYLIAMFGVMDIWFTGRHVLSGDWAGAVVYAVSAAFTLDAARRAEVIA